MVSRKKHRLRKGLSLLLVLGINLLPLQGFIPSAEASNGGLNTPPQDQPQVLILLDNSQGMAGVLQSTNSYSTQTATAPVLSTQLSGAIMTGSGIAAQNNTSSSPPYYQTNNFIPPAYGSASTVVPYTLSCGASGLTAAAQSACSSIHNNGYVDNSPSMLNGIEVSLASVLSNPTYENNLQFALETYKTGTPSLYRTWVYYMSGKGGFSFNSSSSNGATIPVANPCYNNQSNSCKAINNEFYSTNNPQPIGTNSLFNSPTLYINDTSDDPIINDVLYDTSDTANAVGSGPEEKLSDFSLSDYENKSIVIYYSKHSNNIAAGAGPTSAGFTPSSPEVWYSLRGYGYNASVTSNSGKILVPLSSSYNNQNSVNSILKDIGPETFPAGNTITASAGYSPVAGAFTKALSYLTASSTPKTCGQKYVIFITDGQPTMGTGGHVYPPLGSLSAQTLGVTSITASTWSSTNNEAVVEAIQKIQLLANNGIKTYVLGVGSAVAPATAGTTSAQQAVAKQGQAVLTAMAQAGGTTSYYSALTQSDVRAALNNIVANILGKSVVSSYAAPPTVTTGSLEFLLKNVNPINGQGDLYAYPVTSNGSVSSTASWTANGIMTAATRSTALYTTPTSATNGGGSPQTFSKVASTDSAAFGTLPTGLTASDIANYTIDPSYDNGAYLGGRASGWYVGLPSSAPAEVLTPPNNANLLSNSGYLSFASSHANRQNAVLFSDNDGFLYALGYNNTGSPTLLWGWMPGALLPSLQNYSFFWQGSNMGNFASIDASPDGGSTWHTYVVGVAGGGSIYYDLQLTSTGSSGPTLKSVIAQYQLTGDSQPQPSAPVFYQVNTPGANNFGETWAISAINSNSTSYLGILNVTSGVEFLDTLPFTNTATPYIDSNGNLFLGDGSGNVYEMSATNLDSLLNPKGNNSSASTISLTDFDKIPNNFSSAWSSTSLAKNVQFIGGTFYQGKNYLRVQGPSGITIFSQMNGTWSPVWTTYAGGAGTWSGGTAYTSSSSSGNSSTSTSITPLPGGSAISDQALIDAGNVIVPVTIPPGSNTCGTNTAAYYIYALGNGIFPSGAYTSPSDGTITQGYIIGKGTAFTPTVTMFNGRQLLQGAANKNTTGGTSNFPAAIGAGLPLGGPVAWRLDLTQ
ncbi:type IV pilin biogenesis protein [Acidithiobacillus marinus]|uniref:Type IV pilin biogenesis protein n=2 Tax=Acidithiobacillus marinus TaxID=187490 RepID=A0A2I1DJ65_9PROT|nr:type IV pilin biogenesis protein [Acidithiobacillus marinus]